MGYRMQWEILLGCVPYLTYIRSTGCGGGEWIECVFVLSESSDLMMIAA